MQHVLDVVDNTFKLKLASLQMTLLSPLEKNIGHLSLILHEMTKDPAQKKYYEKETIKHWTYYTEWFVENTPK